MLQFLSSEIFHGSDIDIIASLYSWRKALLWLLCNGYEGLDGMQDICSFQPRGTIRYDRTNMGVFKLRCINTSVQLDLLIGHDCTEHGVMMGFHSSKLHQAVFRLSCSI